MLRFKQVIQQPVVQFSFLFSFFFFITSFYLCRYYIYKHSQQERTREKQTSWILTLWSSLVCTVVSIPFVIQFFNADLDMQLLGIDNSFHTGFVCFFITYLMLDLTLGSIYYRERITLMTGWVHHMFYMALLSYFLRLQVSSLFTVSSILELPTLILAIGSIVHEWRSDLLFGSSFFLLRLVAHAWMTVNLKRHHRIEFMWIVALIIYPLHIYWFYGIIQIQIRKLTAYRKMQRLAHKTKYFI
ncbi:uncharacterized protein B0P05DRAFT_543471 [Gilbertella persicaria]|uniref:uncharacterized protein n=1 Tax=Gilbertella persicaria TaxID=101096 RepID=UPI0022208220|nr:uncharacterized protein B0P05DRAFT_543471 [Gilbertella persicaria]KAI8077950.1 hypothetical protein B0P05DRAFT_543471 [Gilbertella persicaria]